MMFSSICLDFEEMRIKTQLKISDEQQKTVETDFSYGAENYEFTRGSLSVSLGDIQNRNRENSLAEIEMVFKRKDPPEALSRLIDHLNNMLQLKNIYKGEESA